MSVGERIKQLRELKNVTRIELSRLTDISEQSLWRYERRSDEHLSLGSMTKIAEALDVPLIYFFSDARLRKVDTDTDGGMIGLLSVNKATLTIKRQSYHLPSESEVITVPSVWCQPCNPVPPFLYEVDVSSMPDAVPDGAQVIVNPNAKLRTGDLCLAAIDGTPCLRGLTGRGETQLLGDREHGCRGATRSSA